SAGSPDLGGKATKLVVVIVRFLQRGGQFQKQRLDVSLARTAVNPVADGLVVDLRRVAGGAGETQPVHVFIVVGRVAYKANRQAIRIKWARRANQKPQPVQIAVVAQQLPGIALLEGKKPVIG